jgi:hypothetical protein
MRTAILPLLLLASAAGEIPLTALGDGGGADSRPASRPAASSEASSPRVKDYASHAAALRRRHAFTVVEEPPFVVIGDAPEGAVRRWATGTVRWAVERLKRDFFEKEPADILDIWLFRDKESYEKNVEVIFGEKPSTPFGYFSPRHKALVMNIATGGGTLVHEIVHPFIHVNFPECPAWFNEGLASLYEQCGDRDGRIVGFTNWRLAGLQEAIREKSLRSFETLLSTTEDEFYEDARATNYAQARYLCYYLQEQGLLVKFYKEFVANAANDPTGVKTLKAVLGVDDLVKFQRAWEAFVKKLTFP